MDSFLATERETLAAVSSNLKPAVTHPNGETTKATYLYFSDIVREIEVTAIFDTQYNADKNRQLFSNVDAISTKLTSRSWYVGANISESYFTRRRKNI